MGEGTEIFGQVSQRLYGATAPLNQFAFVLDGKVISDLGMWVIIAGMLGARAMHVITYWDDQYAGSPLWQVLDFRSGGLVFYGGFIGAAMASSVRANRRDGRRRSDHEAAGTH